MRKSKFTEEQIARALRQAEGGAPVGAICRKLGITESTFFRWKRKFGGLGVPELRELRQLREVAQARTSWGYRQVHTILGREGWKVNHKLLGGGADLEAEAVQAATHGSGMNGGTEAHSPERPMGDGLRSRRVGQRPGPAGVRRSGCACAGMRSAPGGEEVHGRGCVRDPSGGGR